MKEGIVPEPAGPFFFPWKKQGLLLTQEVYMPFLLKGALSNQKMSSAVLYLSKKTGRYPFANFNPNSTDIVKIFYLI